jgi:hypothetical protein
MRDHLNPWRHGDIAETIAKATQLGLTPVVKVYETITTIVESIERIEAEDACRQREREAARKFFSKRGD